ncbi:MAG: S8 family serine peptidase, partial [Cyanobacteria bacterium]|nr:S8 family serine peptidase [Cyanobacteriota bacterium]
ATSLLAQPTMAIERQLKIPSRAIELPRGQAQWRDNTLLMMPFDPNGVEAQNLVKELKGTITSTIGTDDLTVWVVNFRNVKQFAMAEKALSSSKLFHSVQRDYVLTSNDTAGMMVDDPYFPQQWHLPAMNVPRAWNIYQSYSELFNNPVIIDSGVDLIEGSSPVRAELLTTVSYDATKPGSNMDVLPDLTGHGTLVASSAFTAFNNGFGTAGVAPYEQVLPVRVVDKNGRASTSALIEALRFVGNDIRPDRIYGPQIVNISLNAAPPYSLANAKIFPVLHKYFKWFHDRQDGGMIFCSAGNNKSFDRNPQLPYLIVVNAINSNYELASFSNYGYPVWFTAPGTNILCQDKTGTVRSVSGTSFSCPLVCAVAWAMKSIVYRDLSGEWTNLRYEQILKNNCTNIEKGKWNPYYGWGMPDMYACLREVYRQAYPGDPDPGVQPPGTGSLNRPKKK